MKHMAMEQTQSLVAVQYYEVAAYPLAAERKVVNPEREHNGLMEVPQTMEVGTVTLLVVLALAVEGRNH